jgi:hypothetical protein
VIAFGGEQPRPGNRAVSDTVQGGGLRPGAPPESANRCRRIWLMTTEDPKTETKVPEPDAPEAKPGARRRMLRKIAGLLAGFAAAGTILAGLTGYWTTYRTVTKEILAPVKPEQIAPRLSLVVLPFSNLTGNPAQDYLGDVITEELTTRVGTH